MLCVYSYLVRLIAELYIHTLYWFPSVDAVLSLPFVRLALMFMHSQCVYVQCVICVYCVHVYPLDVHYYYPLDKEERSYSVFSPISTATNCCTSNNEKEREREMGFIDCIPDPRQPCPSPSQNELGGQTNKNNERLKRKEANSSQILFCFGDCKRLDDFSSLSHRHCLFSSSVHKTVDLCVSLSFFLCCVEMFHDCQLLLFVYSSLLRPRRASPDWLSLTFGVTALRCRSPRGNAPWIFLEAAGQFSSPPYSFSSGSLV